ncbi:MAG: hypothetical protein SGPRY_014259, partial [Prymnesium sp.]
MEGGLLLSATRTCALGEGCASLLSLEISSSQGKQSASLALESTRLRLTWVRCLKRSGQQVKAAELCAQAA